MFVGINPWILTREHVVGINLWILTTEHVRGHQSMDSNQGTCGHQFMDSDQGTCSWASIHEFWPVNMFVGINPWILTREHIHGHQSMDSDQGTCSWASNHGFWTGNMFDQFLWFWKLVTYYSFIKILFYRYYFSLYMSLKRGNISTWQRLIHLQWWLLRHIVIGITDRLSSLVIFILICLFRLLVFLTKNFH